MNTKPRGVTAAEDEDYTVATKQARRAPHRPPKHEKKAEQKSRESKGERKTTKKKTPTPACSRHVTPRATQQGAFLFLRISGVERISILRASNTKYPDRRACFHLYLLGQPVLTSYQIINYGRVWGATRGHNTRKARSSTQAYCPPKEQERTCNLRPASGPRSRSMLR